MSLPDVPQPPRPARPEYGEYATPEEQAEQRGTPAVRAPATAPPVASTRLPGRLPLARDRFASQLLLLLGALGLGIAINTAFEFDAVMKQAYAQYDVNESFVPTTMTHVAQVVIGVSSIVLYLVALFGTRALQLRGRASFWLPLVVGAVAWAVLLGSMLVVWFNDPYLYEAILRKAQGG